MPTSPNDNYAIDKVDDPLARAGVNSLVGLGTGLVGTIFNYFKDKQQAAKAAEAYAKKYCDRYGKIQLLGMQQEIDLENVYTAVKFWDSLSISKPFGSLNALEDDYRSGGKRRFQRGECKSIKGSKVANEHQYLYVLGNPGAGKSTFLRRVGLEALKGSRGNYQHDLIPVVIELKQFNQGNIDLINMIANELAYFNFPDKIRATEDYLKQGKLLLLFDGLDEVPNSYSDEVQNKIDNLKIKYSDNRFVFSCRIAAYKSPMTGFTTVELADFDEDQIEKFIDNWFSSELDKQNKVAEECWTKLSQPEYKASLELAQTPLLLTFLCITYDAYQDFPDQHSQLYAEALDILLRKWDAQRRIKRDKIYANWNINLELALLSELAYDFFSRDELFFTKDNIVEYIQVFLSETEGDAKFIDSEAVLDAIAIQQGILVERAAGIYSFSHLTLQEYLTAKYISQDNRRIEKLIEEHLTDERWQEVFLLVAGIRNNADDLLLNIEKAINSFVDTPKLQSLLSWVKQVTDTNPGDVQLVGKRALSLANFLANFFAEGNVKSFADSLVNIFLFASANSFFDYISNLACAYTNVNASNDCDNITLQYYDATSEDDLLRHQYYDAISEDDLLRHLKTARYTNALISFIEYTQWLKKYQIYRDLNYHQLITRLEDLRQNIPYNKESKEVDIAFDQKIIQTWLEAFHLPSEIVDLSVLEISEIIALEQYLYANSLMVQCKKTALRVSQETWEGIESQMLLPVKQ